MELTQEVNLGVLIGRRQAFSSVAARCTAAEVVQMKEIHDTKAYLRLAEDWESFCPEFLQMSHDKANKQIQLLENFGPTYFEVAQLTRISPETYRAIAPAIQDQKLHHNGEAIALIPENAEKVGAAVREMRKTVTVKRGKAAPPAASPAPENPVSEMNRRCSRLAMELDSMRKTNAGAVRAAILVLRMRLSEIERLMEV
jgi:hypothetical protein